MKASAFEKGADAIDNLRQGLRGIADDYNQRIANIENSKEPAPMKAAEIERLIAEANGFAAYKSGAAVATITDATQQILTAEGLAMSPQEFLTSQGLSTGGSGEQPSVGGGAIGASNHSGGSQSGHTVRRAVGLVRNPTRVLARESATPGSGSPVAVSSAEAVRLASPSVVVICQVSLE